jgi:hypothetical protein
MFDENKMTITLLTRRVVQNPLNPTEKYIFVTYILLKGFANMCSKGIC